MNFVTRYLAFFVVLPFTAASAAGPFDDICRPNRDFAVSWNCTDIGMDGGAPATRGQEFFGVENHCELTDPVRVNGMSAILYNGMCA